MSSFLLTWNVDLFNAGDVGGQLDLPDLLPLGVEGHELAVHVGNHQVLLSPEQLTYVDDFVRKPSMIQILFVQIHFM
jgi:hypothetical protein